MLLKNEVSTVPTNSTYSTLCLVCLLYTSYGHLCGDAVLSDAAGYFREIFCSSDVVGRVGGDEFLVFLPDIKTREEAAKKAKEMIRSLTQITLWENRGVTLSCSVGIAMYPIDAKDFLSLYRCADRALYYVKNSGRGHYTFYDRKQDDGLPIEFARSAISENIASDIGDLDQTLAQYTFRMLYDSVDIKTAINQILEIVGRAYDVSRVYIFENSEDNLHCNNTFEWCNEGVTPEINNLQHLSYTEDLGLSLIHI